MQRFALLASLLVSCRSPAAIEGVVAEVHVHQWEGGPSHVAAAFVEAPVPFRPELDEQLVHYVTDPVAVDGPCKAHRTPTCTPTCDGERSFCSRDDTCTPYQPLRYVNGGTVHVRGARALRLDFDASVGFYRSTSRPEDRVFVPGETLHVEARDFATTILAPHAPALALVPPLHLAGKTQLALSWPKQGGHITVTLVASSRGDNATITCTLEDRGGVEIAASLLAILPKPPRDLRLDVERFERKLVPSSAGGSAAIKVGATVFLTGWD